MIKKPIPRIFVQEGRDEETPRKHWSMILQPQTGGTTGCRRQSRTTNVSDRFSGHGTRDHLGGKRGFRDSDDHPPEIHCTGSRGEKKWQALGCGGDRPTGQRDHQIRREPDKITLGIHDRRKKRYGTGRSILSSEGERPPGGGRRGRGLPRTCLLDRTK